MRVLWDSYVIPLGCPGCFYGISMELLTMVFLMGFYVILLFYVFSAGFLWDSSGISMIFLWHGIKWDCKRMKIESKLRSIEHELKTIEIEQMSVESNLNINLT